MPCNHCELLKQSVDRLKREYEHSLGLMEQLRGVIDAQAYGRRKRVTDDARREYQLVLTELEAHMTTVHAAVN